MVLAMMIALLVMRILSTNMLLNSRFINVDTVQYYIIIIIIQLIDFSTSKSPFVQDNTCNNSLLIIIVNIYM